MNESKSAVDRPWRRRVLGFTFTGRRPNRRKVSDKAILRFKGEIRQRTQRTRGVTFQRAVALLSLEAMGEAALSRVASPRRKPGSCLEHGEVSPRPMALEP